MRGASLPLTVTWGSRLSMPAFAQRRKTLRAALSSWAGSGARAEQILVAAGIAPDRTR